MKQFKFLVVMVVAFVLCAMARAEGKSFYAKDYGIAPGKAFTAEDVSRLIADVRQADGNKLNRAKIIFEPGNYTIGAAQCQERDWFISNHDQGMKRKVFLPLEELFCVGVDFNGASFTMQGRILFAGVWNTSAISLRGGTFDYEIPMITQVEFLEVDAKAKTVRFRPIAGTQTELQGTRLFFKGYDFRNSPGYGILFEKDGTIAYRTSDCTFNLGKVTDNKDGTFTAANCTHAAFKPGQFMALRTWERPAPGIVISDSHGVTLEDITLHYADGMGVLAQNSASLDLNGIRVIPNRAKGRYYSTQADATHFSACSGTIYSTEGTYVGMMDDAINVHGTYLKLTKRIDERTVEGTFMHHQTYGINWGEAWDEVNFVRSRPMEIVAGSENKIEKIERVDNKRFHIKLMAPIPTEIDPSKENFGIENLTATPSVIFRNNHIANNRARGALFSTPQRVECTYNIFDHISGCGVLLCGDCNGWYETGACHDVTIAHNTFVNALTSPFQFTEAVISIYPEIPELNKQTTPFHSNITIEDNIFVSFTDELIYAKSVDGLTIKNNTFVKSTDYKPYRGKRDWLRLDKCQNVTAELPVGMEK